MCLYCQWPWPFSRRLWLRKQKGGGKKADRRVWQTDFVTHYFVKYSTFCHHFIFLFLACKQSREVPRLLHLLCELEFPCVLLERVRCALNNTSYFWVTFMYEWRLNKYSQNFISFVSCLCNYVASRVAKIERPHFALCFHRRMCR
jgi:hypothetical protein